MRIRLHGIYIPYDEDQRGRLARAVRERLKDSACRLMDFRVVRRSVDARQRQVMLVYSVDVEMEGALRDEWRDAAAPPEAPALRVDPGTTPLAVPPVVVGAGPAGLLAAYLLASHGYRPLLLERGGDVAERIGRLRDFTKTREPDPECNALFGLGGAGTFSDGKLRTGVDHPWRAAVLDLLVACGAPADICIDAKPHVGTDILRSVVENLVARIREQGGMVRTGVRVDGIIKAKGALRGLVTSESAIDSEIAVLAIGHSARDTWQSLEAAGITLAPKPFQLGIRVEHDQLWLDRQRFGNAAGHPALGAADYKVTAKVGGVPVFSFCMCPGGETIPTVSERRHLALNGMSLSSRGSPFASSGLVVTLAPEVYGGRDLASSIGFQRAVERACFEAGGSDYRAPAQRLSDFAHGRVSSSLPRSSYTLGLTSVNLADILPRFVAVPLQKALSVFNKRIPGYLSNEALSLAPESRASSPVRIVRDPRTLESPDAAGLYPVGEGAGHAGGIMSAALDGLNAARKIIETYAPPP